MPYVNVVLDEIKWLLQLQYILDTLHITLHCVPELYANQNFCDNFGNI